LDSTLPVETIKRINRKTTFLSSIVSWRKKEHFPTRLRGILAESKGPAVGIFSSRKVDYPIVKETVLI